MVKQEANNNILDNLKQNINNQNNDTKEQQQNSVLEKLLNAKIGGTASKKMTEEDEKVSMTNMQRVVWLRYKIYTLLIVILGWFVWSSFLSPAINKSDYVSQKLESDDTKLIQLQRKLSQYQKDQKFVALIEGEQNADAIYNCINNNLWCESLDKEIGDHLELVKSYLQIGNLYDRKMVIDEKSLLINLDAFMTKEWKRWFPTDKSNGEIKELLIGDPEQIEEQLYQVPLDVQIEFDDKDALLSFINNVENRIIKWIDTGLARSTPVLYKINQIEYDVVNYTEKQNVVVNMTAYYYQEERDDVLVEHSWSLAPRSPNALLDSWVALTWVNEERTGSQLASWDEKAVIDMDDTTGAAVENREDTTNNTGVADTTTTSK